MLLSPKKRSLLLLLNQRMIFCYLHRKYLRYAAVYFLLFSFLLLIAKQAFIKTKVLKKTSLHPSIIEVMKN